MFRWRGGGETGGELFGVEVMFLEGSIVMMMMIIVKRNEKQRFGE